MQELDGPRREGGRLKDIQPHDMYVKAVALARSDHKMTRAAASVSVGRPIHASSHTWGIA